MLREKSQKEDFWKELLNSKKSKKTQKKKNSKWIALYQFKITRSDVEDFYTNEGSYEKGQKNSAIFEELDKLYPARTFKG